MATATAKYNISSLYSITDFLAVLEGIPPAPSFFKSNLFGTVETTWGDEVAVDYLRGSARCAPYTSKFKRAIAIPRKRFQTQWFRPPDVKVSRDIRALDLASRVPGESTSGKLSADERLAQWQVQDYMDLDQQIVRTEERQCADILFNCKLVIVDGDDQTILQELSFGDVNPTVIDPAAYWDVATSDPLNDLNVMRRAVSASGYMPSFYVMGCDAAQAFLTNEQVKHAYDQFNYRPGQIDPTLLQQMENFGVSALGTYWGMPLFSYEGMFEEAGAMHHYCPPDQILVASKASQNRFCYGSIIQTEDASSSGDGWGTKAVGTYQLPRVPQYVTDAGDDQLKFRLWSRPLAVPVNTKTWSVATVCTLKSQPIPIA